MKQQYRKYCMKCLIKSHVKATLTLLFRTGTLLVLSALCPAGLHCPKTWNILKLSSSLHHLMAKSTLGMHFLGNKQKLIVILIFFIKYTSNFLSMSTYAMKALIRLFEKIPMVYIYIY